MSADQRVLLVASEGGHLVELHMLSQRFNAVDKAWLTFNSPQVRSLLAAQQVYFAPYAGSRDLLGTLRAAVWARNFLRENRFDIVVSTGASIALAVLPIAAHMGSRCYYFESATRTNGPSLTGRLLEPFRSVRLFTQHERWTNARWQYRTSIFDGFTLHPIVEPAPLRRIVVTLGLHKGFSFRRAIERLIKIIPDGTEVLWQTGDSDISGLEIEAHVNLPAAELSKAMADCDAIVTHAGIGSIVSAMKSGKCPVVLPRRKQYGEHVDDHQVLIAEDLQKRNLVVQAPADEVEWADVVRAAAWSIRLTSQ